MPAAMNRALVGFGTDGRFGCDDADDGRKFIARRFSRGAGTGLDNAADRKFGKFGAESRQRQRRRGVAGDDDMFGVMCPKVAYDLSDESRHGGGGF